MSVDAVRTLVDQLNSERGDVTLYDRYYAGRQPLAFLHPQVRQATAGRLTSLVINWPRIIVGAVEERLDVEGFRLAGEEEPISDLWRIWQANNLDEQSGLAHIDALVHGRAYVIVWAGADERTPRITVESAREMTVAHDPMTGEIVAALKAFDVNAVGQATRATLFLRDRVERYAVEQGQGWALVETILHDLGQVPVVEFVNNPRTGLRGGESELADVIPVSDAISKLSTDLMVSAEYHAMPRRYATGMQLGPAKNGVVDERTREVVKQTWTEAEAGRVWVAGPGAEFGQFPEASLDNFVGAIRMFTEHLAAIGKLPPHMLGISTANPASADAIRSAESALVKKAQRKQRGFGGGWERVMRLAQLVRDGEADPELVALETIWASAETPTVAQKADAAVKLLAAGAITVRQVREDLGYTPVQIARMEAEDQAAALGPVQAQLDKAAELESQGIPRAAAYKAVGLIAAGNEISGTEPQ